MQSHNVILLKPSVAQLYIFYVLTAKKTMPWWRVWGGDLPIDVWTMDTFVHFAHQSAAMVLPFCKYEIKTYKKIHIYPCTHQSLTLNVFSCSLSPSQETTRPSVRWVLTTVPWMGTVKRWKIRVWHYIICFKKYKKTTSNNFKHRQI